MLPVIITPRHTDDPQLQSTWAYYGARQLLDMIGLSYVEAAPGDDHEATLVIDPASGQICVNCEPSPGPDYGEVWPILRVELQAEFTPDSPLPPGEGSGVRGNKAVTPLPPGEGPGVRAPDSLPVFGGVRDIQGDVACGVLRYVEAKYGEQGPLFVVQHVGDGAFRIIFNAPIFETIGLYLSRFSWAGNPGYKSFVRYIDVLWAALEDKWGARPVVSDYQDIFTAILRHCYDRLGLVLATKWFHPAIDGEIKFNAMLLTHDVDSVYADSGFRGQQDQSDNPHFNFARWQELESRFGIKSAFYFFSPAPTHQYWLPTPGYLVTDEPVMQAARELAESGWEIAPHELGHRTAEEVAAEVAYFEHVTGRKPPGTRNHYLTNWPDSLKYKAAAGLLYDSTWYAEQTDTSFLCGTVLPYAPLDTASGRPLDIWEFAFVIEDGIVTGCYGADTERGTKEAIADGARGLDIIIARSGYACFNWHQRTFARQTELQHAPDSWVSILEGLLEYYQARAPRWWNPLPGQLAQFWSRRQAAQVESRPGEIVVRNSADDDCPDLVLALHGEAGRAIRGAEKVPGRGISCIAAGLAADEEKTIRLDT